MTPMEVPTAPRDQEAQPATTFVWSMKELREDLGIWSDNYTVTVTLNDEEPGNIWMKFQKGEDGCQD